MTPRRALPLFTAAAATLLLAAVAPVRAERGLLVGVADDRVKWQSRSAGTVAVLRDLGADGLRITLSWEPGSRWPSRYDSDGLRRTVTAAHGMRVVVSIFGRAKDAPADEAARREYCGYVGSVLQRFPTVNDVVIWNEPNSNDFWQPQFRGGESAAPAAYGALLATCWDTLHALRPEVNVISSTSSRGNDNAFAVSNAGHSPGTFVRRLGAWYRASGRARPLLDTAGHHPYPENAAEPPGAKHPHSKTIGEGDLDKLTAALKEAFAGTAQPLPKVWYMEDGFQSAVPGAKTFAYSGRENDPKASDRQAELLAAAVRLAYCQPGVGAFFNFLLVDEPSLSAWQSGLFWADGYPKPAYDAFRAAIADVHAGTVRCA